MIDVIVPVHNEENAIGTVLREFYDVVHVKGGHDIRFVVCEDGSKDNTVGVLKELSKSLPIQLYSKKERLGYSQAVVNGMRNSTADIVCFIDSDGQCDPKDFLHLHPLITDNHLVIGYRNPRKDHWSRILMSKAFGVLYTLLFGIRLIDPSCPFIFIKRESLNKILSGNIPILGYGLWWEFMARAFAMKLRVVQHPVNHRDRFDGDTQVYKINRLPGIALTHIRGLFQLKTELRRKDSVA